MNFVAEIENLIPASRDEDIDWQAMEASMFGGFIHDMEKTPQNPDFHGEGDVFAHMRLVCQGLLGMEEFWQLSGQHQLELFAAAVLHDIGKIKTTRMEDGKWKTPYHSIAGSLMAREFLWKTCGLCGTKEKQQMRETICALICYHMLPVHMLDRQDLERKIREVAAAGELASDFSWKLLCMLSEADIKGRIAPDLEGALEKIQLCEIAAEECGCFTQPYHFTDVHSKHVYLSGRNVMPDQSVYDDTWGEVILMAGLPGTGKDTWIRNNMPELAVISLDEIRKEMGVKPADKQGAVIGKAKERAKVFLRKHQPFVWNATNITRDIRQKLINLFERYGAGVRMVYLETEWETQLCRNSSRNAEVPQEVIENMLKRMTPPLPEEAKTVEWHCV